MIEELHNKRYAAIHRLFSFFLSGIFLGNVIFPPRISYAQIMPQGLSLPAVGTMISLSPSFTPALINGLNTHPENPLLFDFIVDPGESGLQGEALTQEAHKMVKYFLAALTVPHEDMWVNLSPHEKDRIIPEGLGVTEIGRDLLAQDYLLKQLTASLIYPEQDLGQKFWDKVRRVAKEKFGLTDIPMDIFHKIWIVPEKAVVYEHGSSAFVVERRLNVMLEEDYLAMSENRKQRTGSRENLSSDIGYLTSEIKNIILPEIEKEINEGQNFANLRQIYNAMILATWYKQALKESLLGQIYADQNKIKGIDLEDKNVKEKIYNQYLEAFKKGVYNYIKEEYDPTTQEIIPRKYFSGGVVGVQAVQVIKTPADFAQLANPELPGDKTILVTVRTTEIGPEAKEEGIEAVAQAAVPIDKKASPISSDRAMVAGELTTLTDQEWFIAGHPSHLYHSLPHSGNAGEVEYALAKVRGHTEETAGLLKIFAELHDFDPLRGQNTVASVPATLELLMDDFTELVGLDDMAYRSVLKEKLGWGETQYLMAHAFIARTEFPLVDDDSHPNTAAYKNKGTTPYKEYIKALQALKTHLEGSGWSSEEVHTQMKFVIEEAAHFFRYADVLSWYMTKDFEGVLKVVKDLAEEMDVDFKNLAKGSYRFLSPVGLQGDFDIDRNIAAQMGIHDAHFVTREEYLPEGYYDRLQRNLNGFKALKDALEADPDNFEAAVKAGKHAASDAARPKGEASAPGQRQDDQAMMTEEKEAGESSFSFAQPVEFGEKTVVMDAQYAITKPAEPTRYAEISITPQIDQDILKIFRAALSFDHVRHQPLETAATLQSLRPLVEFLADRRSPIDPKDKARFREISQSLQEAVPLDRTRRSALVQEITQFTAALPDTVIQKILQEAVHNLEGFIHGYWHGRIRDWENIRIQFVLNSDRLFDLRRINEGSAVLEVDLLNFMVRFGEYEPRKFALEYAIQGLRADEIFKRKLGEEKLTGFLADHPDVVKEILLALNYVEFDLGNHYATNGLGFKSKDERKTWVAIRKKEYERLGTYPGLRRYIRLWKRLGKIAHLVDGEGRLLYAVDRPGRIREALRFIRQDQELAGRAGLPELMDDETVAVINALFEELFDYQRWTPIWIGPSKEEVRARPGVRRTPEAAQRRGDGEVQRVTRTVYEQRLLEERERKRPSGYVPTQVLAYVAPQESDDRQAKGPARGEDIHSTRQRPDEEIVFVTFSRDESQYLDVIKPALEAMRSTRDSRTKTRIFVDRVWPQFLIARADQAVTEAIARDVQEAAGLLDQTIEASIVSLIELTKNVQANKEAIEQEAKNLRNNEYLRSQGVHCHVEVLTRRHNSPQGPLVHLVSGISFEIDSIEPRTVDGIPAPILYLGDRIDRLNQDVNALGFTYFGDTHGVVLKGIVQENTLRTILPHLNDVPFVAPIGSNIHPINYTIRRAIRMSYPNHPTPEDVEAIILRSRYKSTGDQEYQHTQNELRAVHDIIRQKDGFVVFRTADETTAYLASIVHGDAPFVDLVKVIELYLSYHTSPFAFLGDLPGIYKQATANILLLFAGRLGLNEITAEELEKNPLNSADAILKAVLDQRPAQAGGIRKDYAMLNQDLNKLAGQILNQVIEDQKIGKDYVAATAPPERVGTTKRVSTEEVEVPLPLAAAPRWTRNKIATVIFLTAVAISIFGVPFLYNKSPPEKIDGTAKITLPESPKKGPQKLEKKKEASNIVKEIIPGKETRMRIVNHNLSSLEPWKIERPWTVHTVREGESLSVLSYYYYGAIWDYAQIHEANQDSLEPLPEDPKAYHLLPVGAELVVPSAADPIEYIVRKNDTLEKIARHFKIAQERIAGFNDLTDPDKIDEGQLLLIPRSQYDPPLDSPDRAMVGEDSRKVSEVNRILESAFTTLRTRADLDKLVEEPLLEAARILYDKNIKTISTSANGNDIERGYASIAIDYESLSEKNKEIAERLGKIVRWTNQPDSTKVVFIKIEINAETTVGELINTAIEIVNAFKKQPMTWVEEYTLDQMREIYGFPDLTLEMLLDDGLFYYAPEEQKFYLSQEQYRKAKDQAMTAQDWTKGGIDLNPELLDLQIKRDGNGVPLPLPQQPLSTIQIQGFIPIIINVQPAPDVHLLLGINPQTQEEPLSSSQNFDQNKHSLCLLTRRD